MNFKEKLVSFLVFIKLHSRILPCISPSYICYKVLEGLLIYKKEMIFYYITRF